MAKNRVLKDQVRAALALSGWAEDRHGHMHKTINLTQVGPRKYRVKLQLTSCRIEAQTDVGDRKEWIKFDGAYYKDVRITESGVMHIGRHTFTPALSSKNKG